MQNKKTHYIAKIFIDVLLVACIIAVATIPLWSGPLFKDYYEYSDFQLYVMMVIMASSGILAALILFTLRGMYKTLVDGNPFVPKNVESFRRIAIICAIIALIYIGKCFMVPSPATVIVVIVFIVGTLFCLTLKDLFAKAVYYKEENDYTV